MLVASYLHMLTLLHSVIERVEYEKSFLATIWKHGRFTHDSACPCDQRVTVKRQKGDYVLVSHILKNVLSKRIA